MEQNVAGSNKATSYIRALDLLGPILARRSGSHASITSLWSVESILQLNDLYAFVLDQQRLGDAGIFAGHEVPSYWRSGFYSAALKSYKEFLVLHRCEQKLWAVYQGAAIPAIDLARRLEESPLDEIAELIEDRQIDFATKEGREVLRTVKTRVNQDFFRKMVLDNYRNRCCLTGIPIPQVLRASHIVAWADDEANRMNPANGLCLSATYDAAFDKHLMSIDQDMRLILSPALRDFVADEAYQKHFVALVGQPVQKASRFPPDPALLARHRASLVA